MKDPQTKFFMGKLEKLGLSINRALFSQVSSRSATEVLRAIAYFEEYLKTVSQSREDYSNLDKEVEFIYCLKQGMGNENAYRFLKEGDIEVRRALFNLWLRYSSELNLWNQYKDIDSIRFVSQNGQDFIKFSEVFNMGYTFKYFFDLQESLLLHLGESVLIEKISEDE